MAWKIVAIFLALAAVAALFSILPDDPPAAAIVDTTKNAVSGAAAVGVDQNGNSFLPYPAAPMQPIVKYGCDSDSIEKEEVNQIEEMRVRFSIAIKASALILSFLFCFWMRSYRFSFLPEVGLGIVIGALVGLVLRVVDTGKKFTELAQLNPDVFFNILLPPMILDAGFNMKRQAFFRNIFGITFFAFVGTLVSAFSTGTFIHVMGIAGFVDKIGFLQSLIFGTITSSTEPTVVLATLQRANIDLFSVSVGESVFNDATTMVLFHTLLKHKCKEYNFVTVLSAIGLFIGTLVGSLVIGVAYALLFALLFKHVAMHSNEEFLFYEMSLLVLCPYMAFLTAEAAGLSGIACILFCGLGMAHYTYVNLSEKAKQDFSNLISTASSLASMLVFVYIGAATFTFDHALSGGSFVPFVLIGALVTRALHVIPGVFMINLFRKPDKEPLPLSWKEGVIIWCSGARGSLSFVLAVTAWVNEDVSHAKDMLTGTLFLVVITVLFLGGAVPAMLHLLKVPQRTEDQELERQHTSRAEINASWFLRFDRHWIKPFFTRMPTGYVRPGTAPPTVDDSGSGNVPTLAPVPQKKEKEKDDELRELNNDVLDLEPASGQANGAQPNGAAETGREQDSEA